MTKIKRGNVYKWRKGRDDEREVLIVSGDFRGNDKFLSALLIGNATFGRDVVVIDEDENGNKKCVHCGMVTYILREDVSDLVYETPNHIIEDINKMLCMNLDISNEEILAELNFYKRKCEEYMDKMITA